MLKVAICDTDIQYRKQTADIWFHVCFELGDIDFTFYESGISLLKALVENRFEQDLLIIDPVLPDISGFRILDFMRQQQIETDVILQTKEVELALYGYRYHAFDFIRKPASVRESEQVAGRYLSEKNKDSEGFLSITIQGSQQKLRLGQIQFFESNVRKILAVMEKERIEFYQKMNELEKLLPSCDFMRCHQSYIVNRKYVLSLSSEELVLINQRRIPVSRRYMKNVQNMMKEEVWAFE